MWSIHVGVAKYFVACLRWNPAVYNNIHPNITYKEQHISKQTRGIATIKASLEWRKEDSNHATATIPSYQGWVPYSCSFVGNWVEKCFWQSHYTRQYSSNLPSLCCVCVPDTGRCPPPCLGSLVSAHPCPHTLYSLWERVCMGKH